MSAETSNFIPVLLNGERRSFASGTSLTDIVDQMQLSADRLAIEYNRVIVKRELWPSTIVQNDSEIEVVQFVGGG